MRCLVCEEPISQIYPDRHDVVHDAVVVKIEGNYGSEIYDPPRHHRVTNYLRAYLCDACLEAKAANGMIEMVRETFQPQIRSASWRPGKEFVDRPQ